MAATRVPSGFTLWTAAAFASANRSFTRISVSTFWSELPACCNRSEEHTSELQSRSDLVCRLLLEKKKKHIIDAVFARKSDERHIDDTFAHGGVHGDGTQLAVRTHRVHGRRHRALSSHLASVTNLS